MQALRLAARAPSSAPQSPHTKHNSSVMSCSSAGGGPGARLGESPPRRCPDSLPGSHLGAPAPALGDPADLRVADSAADPVTAVLLLHHDLALRAVHGLALLQHGLEQSRCLPGHRPGWGNCPASSAPRAPRVPSQGRGKLAAPRWLQDHSPLLLCPAQAASLLHAHPVTHYIPPTPSPAGRTARRSEVRGQPGEVPCPLEQCPTPSSPAHLQHLCRLPCSHIILGTQGQVILVLPAVHLLVDGLWGPGKLEVGRLPKG